MSLLALDTATAATVAGVQDERGVVFEARHDPGPQERPGHGARVLELAFAALADAGMELAGVARIGVGVGPGSFTGLKINTIPKCTLCCFFLHEKSTT